MNIRYHAFGFELTNALRQYLEEHIPRGLRHFAPHIVSATVRLDDVNGTHGGADKRCSIVVALARRGAIVARAVHADMYAAIDQAADRIRVAARRAVSRRNPRESKGGRFPAWPGRDARVPLRGFPSRLDDAMDMALHPGDLQL
jgi:ribosomal subunit interface protein